MPNPRRTTCLIDERGHPRLRRHPIVELTARVAGDDPQPPVVVDATVEKVQNTSPLCVVERLGGADVPPELDPSRAGIDVLAPGPPERLARKSSSSGGIRNTGRCIVEVLGCGPREGSVFPEPLGTVTFRSGTCVCDQRWRQECMRLFMAVPLPPEVERATVETMRRLKAANWPVRWVGEDGLHVTLKFLARLPATELMCWRSCSNARPAR